jgi:hypothetical protein
VLIGRRISARIQ